MVFTGPKAKLKGGFKKGAQQEHRGFKVDFEGEPKKQNFRSLLWSVLVVPQKLDS